MSYCVGARCVVLGVAARILRHTRSAASSVGAADTQGRDVYVSTGNEDRPGSCRRGEEECYLVIAMVFEQFIFPCAVPMIASVCPLGRFPFSMHSSFEFDAMGSFEVVLPVWSSSSSSPLVAVCGLSEGSPSLPA